VTELRECPFCGSEKVKLFDGHRPYWTINCECGADVGLCHTQDQAVQFWNRRADDPIPYEPTARGRELLEGE